MTPDRSIAAVSSSPYSNTVSGISDTAQVVLSCEVSIHVYTSYKLVA